MFLTYFGLRVHIVKRAIIGHEKGSSIGYSGKLNLLINCERFPVTREFGARRGDPNGRKPAGPGQALGWETPESSLIFQVTCN